MRSTEPKVLSTSIMSAGTSSRSALLTTLLTAGASAPFITGPNHPYGEGLWPIPALGIGYTETKIIECYDFFRALQGDGEASPNFRDGYAIELISDAILESAKTQTWVDVKSPVEK